MPAPPPPLPPTLVLFGRPGSGKGTLAQLLVARHGFVQISTGQAMRTWSEGSRPEQQALKVDLARGEFGSDELAAQIVSEALAAVPRTARGVILDGFPRTAPQLAAFLAGRLPEAMIAIEVEVPPEVCLDRLSKRYSCPVDGWSRRGPGPCQQCGGTTVRRPEDGDAAAITKRLESFDRLVGPVRDAWRRSGLPFRVIRGDTDPRDLAAWAVWADLTLHADDFVSSLDQ